MPELTTPSPKPWQELSALGAIARLPLSWRRLGKSPRGTGTVLVIPGFMTGDWSTWVMRRSLRRLGYKVHGWGLGNNHGDVPLLMPQISARLLELSRQGPIHLIGWSLGGYLAREIARDHPEHVIQVITLASPVIGGPKYTAAAPYYTNTLKIDLDQLEQEVAARDEVPLRIPVTALYSPNDQVVCPAACIDHHNSVVEHISMPCSHAGFGFHQQVYTILAQKLANPPQEILHGT